MSPTLALCLVAGALGLVGGLQAADGDWPVYLGDKASTHYSTLAQINRRNVRRLQVACHGINRQGDPTRAYPTLVNIGQKLKRPEILQLLDSGRGNMPAVAFLSKPQKESVADLLLDRDTSGPTDRQAIPDKEGIILNEPYTHTGYNRWLDTNGYPAV